MQKRPERLNRFGYLQILHALRERLMTSAVPGQFIGTERELQEEFGVARSTIRKVLALLVDEGWAVHVPKKGVFVGRGLRASDSRVVAFIENGSFVQRQLGSFFEEAMRSSSRSLERVGQSPDYPFDYALQRVLDQDFAGAFIWGFSACPDERLLGQLAFGKPIVALDHRLGTSDTDLVGFDHYQAGYQITEHLIRQGAKRIGLTGMLDTLDTTVARIQGYMKAMFDHGLQPNPEDFLFISTSGDTRPRTGGLASALRSRTSLDGLVILHEFLANSVVEECLRCGIRLPHDLKLATIGDDFAVSVDGVGLTAIQFDWSMLASEAVRLLDERMAELQRPTQTVSIPFRLAIRGLCGAPASECEPARRDLPADQTFHYSSSWRRVSDAPVHPRAIQ